MEACSQLLKYFSRGKFTIFISVDNFDVEPPPPFLLPIFPRYDEDPNLELFEDCIRDKFIKFIFRLRALRHVFIDVFIL